MNIFDAAKNTTTMKKITFILLFLFHLSNGFAQDEALLFKEKISETEPSRDSNLIKVNLAAFALRNISVQYERAIGAKITAAAGINWMPKGSFPLLNNFESVIDNDFTFQYAKKLKVSGVVITPEVRYYFGKSAFRGFYIAPFVRYENFQGSLPIEIELQDDSKTSLPISGNLRSFSAGFSVGAQWRLTENLYLDWMIMGPHYGSSKGSFSGKKDLSEYEIGEYKGELNNLDIPMLKMSYKVNNQGATLRFKGPWAGIRAGFSLGYRF